MLQERKTGREGRKERKRERGKEGDMLPELKVVYTAILQLKAKCGSSMHLTVMKNDWKTGPP